MAKKTPAKKTSKSVSKPTKKVASKSPAKKVTKSVAAKAQVKKASVKKIPKPTPKPAPKTTAAAKKPAAKIAAKKVIAKAAPARKAAPKAVVKTVAKTVKAGPVKKTPAPKSPKAKAGPAPHSSDRVLAQQFVRKPAASKITLSPFLVRQRQRLLELKDTLLDSMRGVARDNLHTGSETSAFGMHQADAGSDAYDRDFALSMLSKEQGSLYEIDQALKRIDDGSYGVCDICEKPIRHDRLEALPFTRYTVECQAELEKRQHHHSVRPHINSLFGLTEEETEGEEEETTENS